MSITQFDVPSPSAPRPFDVLADLPEGTTLLEASAGTGKTTTIATLATRFVVEGRAELSELLLVTFGRAATSELRDRVRERLVSAHRGLAVQTARDSEDPLVAYLARVDQVELARRRVRLMRALADFDAATIATTHGFCQQMLTRLGLLADLDPDAVMVGDVADLVEEVIDDVYLRRYATDAEPALSVRAARLAARAAVSDRLAVLEPDSASQDSLPGQRVAFAREVVAEMARRKRERRLLDYDDLLVLLRDALVDPRAGEQAARRVRERYRVVLIDEFQDTDPVQWQILRTAFHGHRTLVLIGDPKQAVYAFRGGDVVTYLAARRDAATTATLERNWRSDADLIGALARLMRGAALGDAQIVVRPVRPAEHSSAASTPTRRLDGAGAPLRIRQVRRSAFDLRGTLAPRVGAARELVCADVAAQIVTALRTAWLVEPGPDGAPGGRREVRPGDIAVLTRRNADALAVQAALARVGVPAVVSGLASVFGTEAARDWLRLLDALTDPGHGGRAAALALTDFVGWDAARLAGAGEAERDQLAQTVRTWAQLLASRGIGALLEAAGADGLTERLMSRPGGERALTDLRHIGQVLQHVSATQRLGVAALAGWLRGRAAESGSDYAEERSRRLETDRDAVQVLTVHASKGLEFPIVHVPFAWDRFESEEPEELRFHDDTGQRILHVGGPRSEHYVHARRRHLDEERGEDLRLLYVALTRARCQVVTWWSPSSISAGGPLTRMLLGDFAPGEQPPATVPTMTDEAVSAALAALASGSGGTVAIETVDAPPQEVAWSPASPPRTDLALAAWTRSIDRSWRRLSYSALTAQAHVAQHDPVAGQPVAGHPVAGQPGGRGEPETTGVEDEPDAARPGGPDPAGAADTPDGLRAAARPCPLGELPSGALFGTLVHEVLERLDPGVIDEGHLAATLRRLAGERSGGLLSSADLDALAAGLELALSTPLGPLADGTRLRDVAAPDRLSELEFELPLGGGDAPVPTPARLGDISALLRRHLSVEDPLAGYADRLDALANEAAGSGAVDGGPQLRGYLTGSIDAVLRVRTPGEPRYLVVDYKTNRLAPPEEPLTSWHYRPRALAEAMVEAHYPLQLLLYLVALHRFLRWRQPGYDPAVHLGGGLYLFLRGMFSPTDPDGVMAWRPPPDLVIELSALLDATSRTAAPRDAPGAAASGREGAA